MDKRKILIVDDEPSIHLLITKMLGRDYAVVHARNGQEATDIALTELPDLILMDIMMPEMDGYTACSFIKSRSKTKDIPVVMLTAIDFELNKAFAERVGASGYVTKPFTLSDLKKAIEPFIKQ